MVNVRVVPVEIAQRVLQAEGPLLEQPKLMLFRRSLRKADREPELEGHVEARYAQPPARQLHSREVVQREGTLRDEIKQAVEATSRRRDLQNGPRCLAGTDQRRYERQIEVLVLRIEGEVAEDGAPFGANGEPLAGAPLSRCSFSSLGFRREAARRSCMHARIRPVRENPTGGIDRCQRQTELLRRLLDGERTRQIPHDSEWTCCHTAIVAWIDVTDSSARSRARW